MVFKHIINRICLLYWRFFKSPEEYARYIGVKVGKNWFISTCNFGSEPYLINIGNNVQLTMVFLSLLMAAVMLQGDQYHTSIYLEKLLLKIGYM